MSLSPSALYAGALDKASRAFDLPTISDDTQELIQDVLSDLVQLSSRIASLSLFSPNETLDDISTSDLVYLSLPFIRAEVQNRVRTTDSADRTSNLAQVQHHLNTYASSLGTYDIVPESERVLYGQQPSCVRDAVKRREVKIKQYKVEKDLRTRMEVIGRRRQHSDPKDNSLNDFDLVASLLLPSEHDAEDLENENENVLREAMLLLLRLFYAQACVQLEGVDQEVQLLRNAPTPPPLPQSLVDEQQNKMKNQEGMWKVDVTPGFSDKGPLLDPRGKPLQPFTILPASASNRNHLRAQVFGPSHRLPTMTIDEYLEVERQRGGILPSGGFEPEPSSSERLAIDSEMDGTVLGELNAGERRHKDEQWAQYKDAHPRGAGNTMNRG